MRFGLLTGFLLALTSASAEAVVLAFDVPPSETIYTSAEVDGFLIASGHFHLFGDGYFASNGTTYLAYESARGYPFTVSKAGGGTFSLRAFDGAEAVTTAPADRPAAEAIGVRGTRADGSTVTAVLTLDGVHDGGASGSADDFQPFILPPEFSDLTSVLFYGVRSDGRDGGIAVDNLNIDIGASTGDASPPTVSVSSPAAGNVAGTVLVAANATDDTGVFSVQFKLDGSNLGAEVVAAPYSISWDTTAVVDGSHTITAVARDAANNVGSSSVVVNVSNNPVVSTPYFLSFDGVNDYLEVADADGLSFGNGTTDTPLTIETWFRPNTMTAKQNLIGKWGDGSNQEYKLYIASGTIRLDLRDSTRLATISAYTTSSQGSLTGGWHHLAVTYDGRGGSSAANGITIYVDGVVIPITRINNASYVAMQNTAARMQIGRESAAFKQYNGALDEIRIWNLARAQSQLQEYMVSELTGTQPGLVAYWKLNEGVGSVAADDSQAGNHANLYSGPTWASGGAMNPPAPDVTPPDISNVVALALSDSSVTITFSTNETATGWISYATGPACPCADAYSQGTGTSHSVRLTGLTPDTVYYFQAKAVDVAGNSRIASSMTFRTLVTPPDTTPPTLSVVSPSAGTVSGTVSVVANASDSSGVAGVQFKLDGSNLGAEVVAAPYSISWDTTAVVDGSHTITAVARDAANNVGSSSVVVNVSNNPVVSTPYFLSFDGVNDYLEVADADGLSFGNGTTDTPLTIETWFRPNTMTAKQNLIGKWGDGSNQEYKLYIASGTIRLDLRDSTRLATISAYTTSSQGSLTGGWHHLAVTYDGRGGSSAANGITIYVDGVVIPITRINNASYVAMQNTASLLQIGRESAAFKQYNGALDEIRLWNVARTQDNIQSSISQELTGAVPGLNGYWRMNEGAGVLVADDSQYGNIATIRNGVTWNFGGPLGP